MAAVRSPFGLSIRSRSSASSGSRSPDASSSRASTKTRMSASSTPSRAASSEIVMSGIVAREAVDQQGLPCAYVERSAGKRGMATMTQSTPGMREIHDWVDSQVMPPRPGSDDVKRLVAPIISAYVWAWHRRAPGGRYGVVSAIIQFFNDNPAGVTSYTLKFLESCPPSDEQKLAVEALQMADVELVEFAIGICLWGWADDERKRQIPSGPEQPHDLDKLWEWSFKCVTEYVESTGSTQKNMHIDDAAWAIAILCYVDFALWTPRCTWRQAFLHINSGVSQRKYILEARDAIEKHLKRTPANNKAVNLLNGWSDRWREAQPILRLAQSTVVYMLGVGT